MLVARLTGHGACARVAQQVREQPSRQAQVDTICRYLAVKAPRVPTRPDRYERVESRLTGKCRRLVGLLPPGSEPQVAAALGSALKPRTDTPPKHRWDACDEYNDAVRAYRGRRHSAVIELMGERFRVRAADDDHKPLLVGVRERDQHKACIEFAPCSVLRISSSSHGTRDLDAPDNKALAPNSGAVSAPTPIAANSTVRFMGEEYHLLWQRVDGHERHCVGRRVRDDAAVLLELGADGKARRITPAFRVGQYECIPLPTKLGSGSFGGVFEAVVFEGTGKPRVAALKSSPAYAPTDPGHMPPPARETAEDVSEAQSLLHAEYGRILDVGEHPGIVKAMACDDGYVGRLGEPARPARLVLERVPGTDLERVLDSLQQPASSDAVRNVARQVADALRHMHARNIVHGDIKPSNIILDGPLETGRVRVVDFGLAWRWRKNRTCLDGTPRFMSPQILRGQPYGKEVDVWALGATLYLLATLEDFFVVCGQEKPSDIDYRGWHVKFPTDVRLDPDVRDLISRCLDPDPESRITAEQILRKVGIVTSRLADSLSTEVCTIL
jgi:hypothetical protein